MLQLFPLFSVVIVAAALLSFANHRFIKLPTSIGVTTIALLLSLLLLAGSALGLPLHGFAVELIQRLHFRETLLDGMLALLLFAGALHVDLDTLLREKLAVGLLATFGVVISTAVVGGLIVVALRLLGFQMSLAEGLLFGALISPTDPIAVLGMLRAARAPKRLQVLMAGESLFNDGVGVVVFFVLAGVVAGKTVGVHEIALGLLWEVAGGLGLGLLVGWLAFLMLRAVDNYQVEVLITLALAMGLYSLAARLHTSGPLAVVVAGLLVGNLGRAQAMSAETIKYLDAFWEIVDEILNVALFALIGFEILVVPFDWHLAAAGLLAIPLVLFARLISVGGTLIVLRKLRPGPPGAIRILTWGGLRGGIAVALALSLGPEVASWKPMLTMTYVAVVFSIVVQGLTFPRLLRRQT